MSEDLGVTVKKDENFSEWYTQVVLKSGLVDIRYGIQGFVVHRPWAMRIIKRLYQMFEEELDMTGHEPALFPLLIPEENLKKEKEHFDFAPEVFWITEAGSGKLENRYALRPTSETAIYPMYSLWVRSYRDLPLKYYQSVSVYRYEPTTRPFLRGREFLWIEAHDVFADHKSALNQVSEDMRICKRVVEDGLGINFNFFRRPKWDKFKGADDTYAADCMMPDGRVNQIASTHDLGQNFSKAFDVNFKDEDENQRVAWQTTFGMGIWRIMASIVAVYGDDNGLILPPSVSPYQVVIVPIYKKGQGEQVVERCKELKTSLSEFRVYVDDRDGKSPGFKFNEWELLGVPLRVEVGKRELDSGKITITRRDTKEKVECSINDMSQKLSQELNDIQSRLFDKSKKISSVIDAKSFDEVKSNSEGGSFIRVPFCTTDLDGESCAEKIKPFGLHVRGSLLETEEPSGQCVVCGKPSTCIVYLSRAY